VFPVFPRIVQAFPTPQQAATPQQALQRIVLSNPALAPILSNPSALQVILADPIWLRVLAEPEVQQVIATDPSAFLSAIISQSGCREAHVSCFRGCEVTIEDERLRGRCFGNCTRSWIACENAARLVQALRRARRL
jgi:hypothetical protein